MVWDGFLKFWQNNINETDNPKSYVLEKFVDKSGIHHLSVYEDKIDSINYIFIIAVSFNGKLHLLQIIDNNEIKILNIDDYGFNFTQNGESYWAIKFDKDLENNQNFSKFVTTSPNGKIKIWNFKILNGLPNFEFYGDINLGHNNGFPTCIDLSIVENKLSIGDSNGEVLIFELNSLKPLFTFHNNSLQNSSNSTVRSIKFSPLGKILAVAKDIGNYGIITLYDTKYGENIGNLTIPSHSTKNSNGIYSHDGWCFEIDFNETGESLVSCGYDSKVRVWNVENRERESTLNLSPSDLDYEDSNANNNDDLGTSPAIGVKFIKKGIRGGAGGDKNDGLVVISLDKGIRWYREAGGI
ncbi:hypothetical protein WICMUC_001049 [Wickerhamomyces mucosus]|uniref:Uncharacterized protein n=1 Tax=Wickerhamomyces mucosus TaxID=1378264 RepID=A0A9P8TH46_9ASCO|nr:hypothetical protein WICMUC_001049 [Wickerhamomyces mucosus]